MPEQIVTVMLSPGEAAARAEADAKARAFQAALIADDPVPVDPELVSTKAALPGVENKLADATAKIDELTTTLAGAVSELAAERTARASAEARLSAALADLSR